MPAQITFDFSQTVEQIQNMVSSFISAIPQLVVAVIVFILFMIGSRIVQSLVKKWTEPYGPANVSLLLGRMAKWAMLVVGVLVAIAVVAPSVTPAQLLSVLGVGSVAIGFAFKDILQNFLAGILILLRQPFKIGDIITFGDYTGIVQDIETRSTLLKTFGGQQVIIPNGEIFTGIVQVISAYPSRRNECVIGVDYGANIREVVQLLERETAEVEAVLEDPAPQVQDIKFGAESVNLTLRWWAMNENWLKAGLGVHLMLKEVLERANVNIPYPIRVIKFDAEKLPQLAAGE